jgi:hypothetical protein
VKPKKLQVKVKKPIIVTLNFSALKKQSFKNRYEDIRIKIFEQINLFEDNKNNCS